MTEVTIDRALIEQALEALEIGDNFRPGLARVALRAALAEPAVEPVMLYHGRCTIDCGEHGHHDVEMLRMIPAGTKLYASLAEPAPVPLLSDEEIHGIYDELARSEPYRGAVTRCNVARAIEQLVRRKAGL